MTPTMTVRCCVIVPNLRRWRACVKQRTISCFGVAGAQRGRLRCPACGAEMRIVAFITQRAVIDRILDHCGALANRRGRRRVRSAGRGRPPSGSAPELLARAPAARLSCSHAHITRTFRISRSPAPPRRESPLGDLWAARRMRRRQPLDPPTRDRAHAGAGWSFPDLPPRGPLPVYAVLDALQDPRPPHARGAAGGLSFLLQTPGHSPSVPPGRVMLKQARSRKAPDVPWQTPCRLGEADSCNEFLEAWVALQRFVSRIDVQVDEAARSRLVRALE